MAWHLSFKTVADMVGEDQSYVDRVALHDAANSPAALERWQDLLREVHDILTRSGFAKHDWAVQPSHIARMLILSRMRGLGILSKLPSGSAAETAVLDYLFFRTEERSRIEFYVQPGVGPDSVRRIRDHLRDPHGYGGDDVVLAAVCRGQEYCQSLFALPSSLKRLQCTHLSRALKDCTPCDDIGTSLLNTFHVAFPRIFYARHLFEGFRAPFILEYSKPTWHWLQRHPHIVEMFANVVEPSTPAETTEDVHVQTELTPELSKFIVVCESTFQELQATNDPLAIFAVTDVTSDACPIFREIADATGVCCMLFNPYDRFAWNSTPTQDAIAWKSPTGHFGPRNLDDKPPLLEFQQGILFACSILRHLLLMKGARRFRNIGFSSRMSPDQREFVRELVIRLNLYHYFDDEVPLSICMPDSDSDDLNYYMATLEREDSAQVGSESLPSLSGSPSNSDLHPQAREVALPSGTLISPSGNLVSDEDFFRDFM